jgi:acyl-CoA synthetase (AMP-forming)/AMP-acid ligase II
MLQSKARPKIIRINSDEEAMTTQSVDSKPQEATALQAYGFHPCVFAKTHPDKPAIIMSGSGQVITFSQLDAMSNQVAHLLRQHHLQIGDKIGVCLDNDPLYLVLAWGAQRAGLFMTTIPYRLTAPEIAYILQDSGAKMLFGSQQFGDLLDATALLTPDVVQLRLESDEGMNLESMLRRMPVTPIADERAGSDLLYSSGTTGKPKAVDVGLPVDPAIDARHWIGTMIEGFGATQESVFLSPAPLYHAAPIRWSMAFQRIGATVVVMEKFDAQAALAAIEKYQVTDSQWVPTHFVRMLDLPQVVRQQYDLRSHRYATHAAAPCPVGIKQAMIDWWGPIILEYYGASEGIGFTMIGSDDWLKHPGSVGRAIIGVLRICDDQGNEVQTRTEGQVFFETERTFSYLNAPEKTKECYNQQGWASVGDVGWVDEDGYLYLTDRKSHMIISGGVNIYPQEIENLLIMHPKVSDVAVIGAPDKEMGEKVVAVVMPKDMAQAGPELAAELSQWLAPQLSRIKTPRQIDFRAELPREPTGKLFKRKLRDEYLAAAKDIHPT